MQKLIRRTAQAERQATRRITKKSDSFKHAEQQERFKKRMSAVRETNVALKLARQRRREDWEMGSLAPMRDTPIKGPDGAYWGSLPLSRALGQLPQKQIDLACKWAGGSKYLCLKPGDKLAIMEGPDKGQIGTLRSISLEEGAVILEAEELEQNYTLSDLVTKAKIISEDTFVQPNPAKVPIQAVRLVHPLRDPKTGKCRDVIINELVPRKIFRDKPTGRVTWDRVISGMEIEIPWPPETEAAERKEKQLVEDNPCDTLRRDVEDVTYVPTLMRPPMPTPIIDELRNRYSKFRTRHSAEYLKLMESRDASDEKRKQHDREIMSTPLQEIKAKYRRMRKQRGQPILTDSMLVKIGEVMAKNFHKAPALSGAAHLIPCVQSEANVVYKADLSQTPDTSR